MVTNTLIPRLDPNKLLKKLENNLGTGYLQVSSGSVSWQIHSHHGKLTYASNSILSHPVYSFTRLKTHLSRMGYDSALATVRSSFREPLFFSSSRGQHIQYPEYQAIRWLLDKHHLNDTQAASLIGKLMRENLELFLSLKEGKDEFYSYSPRIQTLYEFAIQPTIGYCKRRWYAWQSLASVIASPYQRPYVRNQELFCKANEKDEVESSIKQKLVPLLNGHSIRYIADLLRRDELEFAKFLRPYIENSSIILREPEAPFNKLPKFDPTESTPKSKLNFSQNNGKVPVVACVDDSPNTLDTIERLLGHERFSFVKFQQPTKAAILLARLQPDIIFLDVTMPKINGYELCRMLRHHSTFKEIPIVMVTGRDGMLDKVKAKMVGASDYVTKPFTESDLLKVIDKHLDQTPNYL